MDDVRKTLERLVRLQEVELAKAKVLEELAEGPRRLAEIEATLEAARGDLAAAVEELDEAARLRRSLEGEIESIKARISRYQDQLMGVKTNEEYRALTREIATEKAHIDAREEEILLSMERTEELERVRKEREGVLAVDEERVRRESEALAGANRRLEAERADLDKERDGLVGSLPDSAVALFERIMKLRGGVAMSRVAGETCGGCQVRCRPQAVAEARAFERLVQCDMCSRILYLPPPAAGARPDGDGEG